MYQPKFNSVLVEIDDADALWGGGNDESMLGASFSKGKAVAMGTLVNTNNYPLVDAQELPDLLTDITDCIGKDILWNEGAEAGTVFEEDGKKYGFIYWWDIRGVKE